MTTLPAIGSPAEKRMRALEHINALMDQSDRARRSCTTVHTATLRFLIQALCSDCPPVGYPVDTTRCLPCPRRDEGIAA